MLLEMLSYNQLKLSTYTVRSTDAISIVKEIGISKESADLFIDIQNTICLPQLTFGSIQCTSQ